MIARTLQENSSVIGRLKPRPERALEVGALPTQYCVLSTPEAADIQERIGINLREQGEAPGGVRVEVADARCLPFPAGHFDLVVCASTLEHIPDFWLAVSEMHRVLAPGGHLLVSTPGYRRLRGESVLFRIADRLKLPDVLRRGTITMRVHDAKDYYRFSPDAYQEIILANLCEVKIWSIMIPPRIYGLGRKPDGH